MTKVLIVSDIHGDRAILEEIRHHWDGKVEATFYNGDSELAADDPVFDGVSTVIGNKDTDDNFVPARSTEIDGLRIFQTHGHLYDATVPGEWANLKEMDAMANEVGAQLVLFGHTHKVGTELFDHKLFINPGSISLPLGPLADRLGGTYAVLSIDDQILTVEFYNRKNEVIPELQFEIKRDQLS
ncbi:YfcE family phosphodiesterase [Eupransor demetentiae]|uniref:Phosphoesterase n=1 Tax=Eupransor demetentiae TaxID=3109584 RepID=A0ABM9N504_9LACO|nr:Predicted phosphodiesterase [Lactobacillaceae bacterium LMG 33000]